ncbi:DUF4259 domain-containing protein [Streptomyces sp. NPDC006307]|uniref:DUF4259 domain-containing protein n=1 Tax=Streptomyces sp. NPDC006307 TaxID=3156748 RepID=UPI0033B3DD53
MGTWDTGPFDNDTAADFAGDLDEAAEDERAGLLRDALARAAGTTGYLEADVADTAVAAAALVAAQCPGGEPTDQVYGPEEPLPDLTPLRGLALDALDRVMSEPSELLELWAGAEGASWRTGVERIRRSLVSGPA